MATPTYTAIASQTLASSASSVTFSSIPGTYRDLILVCRNVTNGTIAIRLNGDTSSSYTSIRMSGNGSTATSGTQSNTYFSPAYWCDPGSGYMLKMDIFDYAQTNKQKSLLASAENTGNGTERFALKWANTSAITSIVFYDASGSSNLNSGGTYALYGIAA